MPTRTLEPSSSATPGLGIEHRDESLHVALSGDWTADLARAMEGPATQIVERAGAAERLVLDLTAIERLDTIGAWIIDRTVRDLRTRGREVDLVSIQVRHRT